MIKIFCLSSILYGISGRFTLIVDEMMDFMAEVYVYNVPPCVRNLFH